MAVFDSLEQLPNDPILGLTQAFNKDPRPEKVNLGVGAYKDAEGLPFVLNCVRKAEQWIFNQHLDKEYPPIAGNSNFIKASINLVFGKQSDTSCVFGAQTLGGTGALRIAGEFLSRNQICSTIYLSNPTWSNHFSIFQNSGLKTDTYTYYNSLRHEINFPALCDSIQHIPENTAILFQPCCHNPTGADPNFSQWEELCVLTKRKKIFPILDLAYQGFDQGIEEDAQMVRLFAKHHTEMIVASSYSKNFGLYGERAGHLSIVCESPEAACIAGSQIKRIIRSNYSMPPLHGGRIVEKILTSDALKNEWAEELENMRGRLREIRSMLVSNLSVRGQSSPFSYLSKQTGLFSLLGLNPNQTERLKKERGIYMPSNGRINIAGLNTKNLDYFIDSLLSIQESK